MPEVDWYREHRRKRRKAVFTMIRETIIFVVLTSACICLLMFQEDMGNLAWWCVVILLLIYGALYVATVYTGFGLLRALDDNLQAKAELQAVLKQLENHGMEKT